MLNCKDAAVSKCHVIFYAKKIGFKSFSDQILLVLRSEAKLEENSIICFHNEALYLSDYQSMQKKCCNPYLGVPGVSYSHSIFFLNSKQYVYQVWLKLLKAFNSFGLLLLDTARDAEEKMPWLITIARVILLSTFRLVYISNRR